MNPKTPPLHLQIQAVIDPEVPVAVVVNALVTAIDTLFACGVLVKTAQIEPRGLGVGYLHTLRARPDLVAGVSVQPLPDFGGMTVCIPKATPGSAT